MAAWLYGRLRGSLAEECPDSNSGKYWSNGMDLRYLDAHTDETASLQRETNRLMARTPTHRSNIFSDAGICSSSLQLPPGSAAFLGPLWELSAATGVRPVE